LRKNIEIVGIISTTQNILTHNMLIPYSYSLYTEGLLLGNLFLWTTRTKSEKAKWLLTQIQAVTTFTFLSFTGFDSLTIKLLTLYQGFFCHFLLIFTLLWNA